MRPPPGCVSLLTFGWIGSKLVRYHPGGSKVPSPVKPIPQGFHSVTPYLTVSDAARALDFYKRAFGAQEVMRMAGPDGKIGHAEIKIGDSIIMLADEMPG